MQRNMKVRDHLEDLGRCGRIILKWILKKVEWDGVDQNDLTQGRNKWQAVMNTVINFRVL